MLEGVLAREVTTTSFFSKMIDNVGLLKTARNTLFISSVALGDSEPKVLLVRRVCVTENNQYSEFGEVTVTVGNTVGDVGAAEGSLVVGEADGSKVGAIVLDGLAVLVKDGFPVADGGSGDSVGVSEGDSVALPLSTGLLDEGNRDGPLGVRIGFSEGPDGAIVGTLLAEGAVIGIPLTSPLSLLGATLYGRDSSGLNAGD